MIPCIEVRRGYCQASCRLDAYLEVLKALLQLIPLGKVTTYKELSRLISTTPIVIGGLLKRNDQPIIVPCHRVVRSDGKVGGYTWMGRLNPDFKKNLLMLEGVQTDKDKVPENFLYSLYERLAKAGKR